MLVAAGNDTLAKRTQLKNAYATRLVAAGNDTLVNALQEANA